MSEIEKQELISKLKRNEGNPMTIKKQIAHNVTQQYNGNDAAEEASSFFSSQTQSRSMEAKQFSDVQLETLNLSSENLSLLDLCSAIESNRSRSDIRRLIQYGGISVENTKITDPNHKFATITDGTRLKIGKRGYYAIKTEV